MTEEQELKFEKWWMENFNFDLFGGTWRDALCCQVARMAWTEALKQIY